MKEEIVHMQGEAFMQAAAKLNETGEYDKVIALCTEVLEQNQE